MKNLNLLTFLFLTITCKVHAQKNIDGFLGIPFGSYTGQVIDSMKTKNATEDITFNNKYLKTKILKFNNASIGGRTCDDFSVIFVNDKAAQAEFIFIPTESIVVKYYNDLVLAIAGVYGPPQNNSPDYYSSYGVNEHREVADLKSGAKRYESTWTNKYNSNVIILSVVSDVNYQLSIKLIYRNTDLYNQRQAQQTDKLSEF